MVGISRVITQRVICFGVNVGALTKGDRRAATGVDLMEFNYDTPYGRAALKTMYTGICTVRLSPCIAAVSCSVQ